MKLFYIGIIKTPPAGTNEEPIQLAFAKDLSSFSFFERMKVDQGMTFLATTLGARTKPGQRQSLEQGTLYVGHAYSRAEGIAGVILADREYPVRVAFSLLNKVLEEYLSKYPADRIKNTTSPAGFEFPQLEEYIHKYQDPKQADTIMRVQQELDETKITLHKTIESVLRRGENLDQLVDKSEALSSTSKMFYKQAKKTNSCCVVM